MTSQWSDQRLHRDLHAVAAPDTLKPFTSKQDAFDRLMPYHVFNSSGTPAPSEGRYSAEYVMKAAEPAERARKRQKVYRTTFNSLVFNAGLGPCMLISTVMTAFLTTGLGMIRLVACLSDCLLAEF